MRLTPFLFSQNLATDNALSTIQVIHQLIAKINDVVNTLNDLELDSNTYTDTKIKELNDNLTKSINDLNDDLISYTDLKNLTLQRTLENELNVVKYDGQSYTNDKIKALDTKLSDDINRCYTFIDNAKKEFTLRIEYEDVKLTKEINDCYNELLNIIDKGNVSIYSCVDGNLKSVYDTLIDLNNIIQQKNGVSWSSFIYLCTRPDCMLTWDRWVNKLNTLANFNNWYSLAYYTCMCLNESMTNLNGTGVNVQNTPMMLSLLQGDSFY